MSRSEFLLELDKVIEASPGTLKGDEKLAGLSAWDSLAVIGFIAMVDDKFRVQLAARDIGACERVADLEALLGDRITP
jgi:acyl carrier protein